MLPAGVREVMFGPALSRGRVAEDAVARRVGYGSDVVVIYGPEGTLIASLGLTDVLSKKQIANRPRSVSSSLWGGEHHFDETEQHVVLQVVAKMPKDYGSP